MTTSQPETPPATREKAIDMTVHAQCEGFHIELNFNGPLSRLAKTLSRLSEYGITPLPAGAVTPNGKPKVQRVAPAYNGDGDPVCPQHQRVLKQGQWGLYCSHKDKTSSEYCKLKFVEE